MIRLIISAIAFVVALGIFFMYTQPTYDSTRELKDKIRQYNQALDKAAELQQLKQALLSRYNAFDPADLSRLQKLLSIISQGVTVWRSKTSLSVHLARTKKTRKNLPWALLASRNRNSIHSRYNSLHKQHTRSSCNFYRSWNQACASLTLFPLRLLRRRTPPRRRSRYIVSVLP